MRNSPIKHGLSSREPPDSYHIQNYLPFGLLQGPCREGVITLFSQTQPAPQMPLNSSAVLCLENKCQITHTPTLPTWNRGGFLRDRLQRARDEESTSTMNFSPGVCMTISCPLHPSQCFLHGSSLCKMHMGPAVLFGLRCSVTWFDVGRGFCWPGPQCDLRNLPSHRGGSAGTVRMRTLLCIPFSLTSPLCSPFASNHWTCHKAILTAGHAGPEPCLSSSTWASARQRMKPQVPASAICQRRCCYPLVAQQMKTLHL